MVQKKPDKTRLPTDLRQAVEEMLRRQREVWATQRRISRELREERESRLR